MLGDDLGRDGAVTAPGSSLRLFPLPKLRGLPSLPWRELGEAWMDTQMRSLDAMRGQRPGGRRHARQGSADAE